MRNHSLLIRCQGLLVCVMAVWMLTGCATSPQRLVFDRFAGAYRLTNDTVQVTVVPEIGRVVSYSMIDGSGEMIWWNPAVNPQDKWVNWGGDKAWPWSQDDWGGVWGGGWPPPAAMDGKPYTVTHADARSLRMISSVDEKQGLQMACDVLLDESGTGVTMRYTLIRAKPASGPAWGAWSVTQVRIPDTLLARIPGDREPNVQNMSAGKQWKSVMQVAGNVLQFERDPATHAKVGVDADRFLASRGDWAISITLDPATTAGSYVATEKGQLYVTGDQADPKLLNRSYLELEFTSPRLPLEKAGDKVILVTRWELHHLPEATLADWVKQTGNANQ